MAKREKAAFPMPPGVGWRICYSILENIPTFGVDDSILGYICLLTKTQSSPKTRALKGFPAKAFLKETNPVAIATAHYGKSRRITVTILYSTLYGILYSK